MSKTALTTTRLLPSFFDDDTFGLPERLFDLRWPAFFNDRSFRSTALPAVNIKDNTTSFDLELAVPGYKKEDLKVNVKDGVLLITAETKQENEEQKNGYTRREFSSSSFQRSFTLPEHTDGENVKAHYENGILQLSVPKTKVAGEKPGKEIRIQ